MSGIGKRQVGWGIAAIAVTGALAAVLMAPSSPARPEATELRFMSTRAGQVRELVVAEGSIVEVGDDLVMLDDEAAQKELLLTQGNLQKVLEGARGSDVAVALPGPPPGLGGQIVQTGPMNPTPSGPGPGKMPKNVKPLPQVEGTPDSAREIVPKPDASTLARLKKEAEKEISDAKAEEAYCLSEIENTKLELEEAQRALTTSKGITERAKFDSDQGKRLLLEGAISRNASAVRDGQLRAQQAILENNQKRVDEAAAKIEALNVDLEKAKSRREKSESDLREAPAKATPTIESVKRLPEAPKTEQKPQFVRKPAIVVPRPSEGSTAPAKVEIDKSAKIETDALLSEAKAKLALAEQGVLERRISAPKRMKIVKWLVRPSDPIRVGQAIAVVEYLPETKPPVKSESQPEEGKPAAVGILRGTRRPGTV